MTDCSGNTRCPLCHTLQGDFDKNKPFTTVDEALRTGLCLLHFGPRAMEWFLNIGKHQGKQTFDDSVTNSLIIESKYAMQ